MKNKDLAKIDTNCCKHKNSNDYILGFIGFKCCKVAMCCNCDKRQFIGGWLGKLVLPFAKKFFHNRTAVVAHYDKKDISNAFIERGLCK